LGKEKSTGTSNRFMLTITYKEKRGGQRTTSPKAKGRAGNVF